jgi:hypothetical protein
MPSDPDAYRSRSMRQELVMDAVGTSMRSDRAIHPVYTARPVLASAFSIDRV